MPDLTEMQRRFVAEYTSGPGAISNGSEAARRAGYSERSAAEIARQLLDNPRVREAILQTSKAQVGNLTGLAVERLRQILADDKMPPKLHLEASKTVLDRAGIIAPRAEEPASKKKDPHEMSQEELRDFIKQGRQALGQLERQAVEIMDGGETAH